MRECPACHKLRLPRVTGSELAVRCQNQECGAIFDRENRRVTAAGDVIEVPPEGEATNEPSE